MFARIDEKSLSVVIMCGPNERFDPGDDTRAMQGKINEIRSLFATRVKPLMEEIESMVNVFNEKYTIKPEQPEKKEEGKVKKLKKKKKK